MSTIFNWILIITNGIITVFFCHMNYKNNMAMIGPG